MVTSSLVLLSLTLAGVGAYIVRRSIDAENATPLDIED